MGLRVFPLQPGTKIPMTAHGVKDATDDPALIKEWWTRTPEAGIGLAARGQQVGDPCFLEFDQRPWLAAWAKELGQEKPVTRLHKSGGKASPHYIFTHTEKSLELGNVNGNCNGAEWFSFRADGRYVVAPPSIHPDTKLEYECVVDTEPTPIPDWLVAKIAKEGVSEKRFGEGLRQCSEDFDPDSFFDWLEQAGCKLGTEDGSWIPFEVCPVVGRRHDGQGVRGCALYWDGGGIGFKCMAQGCPSNVERKEKQSGIGYLISFLSTEFERYDGIIWDEETAEELAEETFGAVKEPEEKSVKQELAELKAKHDAQVKAAGGISIEEIDRIVAAPAERSEAPAASHAPSGARGGTHPCKKCSIPIDDKRMTSVCDACATKEQLPKRKRGKFNEDNSGGYCQGGCGKMLVGQRTCDDCKAKGLGQDSLGLVFKSPKVARQKPRPYVIAPSLGQIDGWFPLGEVSLVGAPSGASKTTLLYQLLIAQTRGEKFFGHETYGRTFAVMAVDRGEAAHEMTMERMRLPLNSIPYSRMEPAFDIDAVQQVVRHLEKISPRPEVLVVEGVDMLVSEINDIKCVTGFMLGLDCVAKHFNIAVVGTLGAPKIKAGQGYAAKRDNLLGSSAWARFAETVINLQFPKGDDAKGRRLMYALLRNAPAEEFTLEFKDGQLVQATDIEDEELGGSAEILWFETQKDWWTILDMSRALMIGESTAYRHVNDAWTKDIIRRKTGPKTGKGHAAMFKWNEGADNPILVKRELLNNEARIDQEIGVL